jgi:transcriptional regulator with XRE-family HTH domain
VSNIIALQEVMIVRSKLRRLRKEKGWTTQKAADKCGISRRMYVYIEQGVRFPNPIVLNKMEDLFEMPQRELLVLDSTTGTKETKEKILENSSV